LRLERKNRKQQYSGRAQKNSFKAVSITKVTHSKKRKKLAFQDKVATRYLKSVKLSAESSVASSGSGGRTDARVMKELILYLWSLLT
jgi:hypothetical protein